MRKTKIIATLGPATDSKETLQELILAGANVFRLNMSHAPHDWVRTVVPRIRSISEQLKSNTAILLDTQGPAIRTGDLPTKLELKHGDIFEFTVRGECSEEAYSVDVNYDGLIDDISEGDTVLVDNGVIHMKVLSKKGHRIRCEVLTEGLMGSRRHINLPGVKVNLPPLTEKDLADVALGAEMAVDYVALSFCREGSDLDLLRDVLKSHASKAHIIAKIEDQLAVRNLDDIIRKSDVVMVARGDLGIECPMEDLPIIQRRIVKRCIKHGRPVIVATHLLESMIVNPVPTRAEVTDVANAVFEQADAIMLSGETTTGKYPIKCVQVLDRVARRIERSGGADFASETVLVDDRQKTVRAAVALANSLPGAKLLVFTRRGTMARYVSGQRPNHAPIFAIAPSEAVARRLALNWGTNAFAIPFHAPSDQAIPEAEKLLLARQLVHPGDKLVIVSDAPGTNAHFDAIQLREVTKPSA
jgi:pyruvate kinase